MKLELRVGNKKIIEPEFKVYTHVSDDDLILIGLRGISIEDEEKISGSINRGDYNIDMSNGVVGLTIDTFIYSFDISYFLTSFFESRNKQYFFITFAFLTELDKIKPREGTAIKMEKKWKS